MRHYKVKTKNRVRRPRKKERMRMRKLAQTVLRDGVMLTSGKVIEWSDENKLHQTPAERRFGEILKEIGARQLFRVQQPLYGFIIDFYAPKYMLAVEIDGGYHGNAEQEKYDAVRTAKLNRKGIVLVRFKNEEVMQHPEMVMSVVQNKIKNSALLVKIRSNARGRKFRENKAYKMPEVKEEKKIESKVVLLRRDGNTVRWV